MCKQFYLKRSGNENDINFRYITSGRESGKGSFRVQILDRFWTGFGLKSTVSKIFAVRLSPVDVKNPLQAIYKCGTKANIQPNVTALKVFYDSGTKNFTEARFHIVF